MYDWIGNYSGKEFDGPWMNAKKEYTIVHAIPVFGEEEVSLGELRWRKKSLEGNVRVH